MIWNGRILKGLRVEGVNAETQGKVNHRWTQMDTDFKGRTARVKAIPFPSSIPCVLCALCGLPSAICVHLCSSVVLFFSILNSIGSAYGNRTRLSALRGPCPNR